jgi:hypothetical protein
MTIGRAVATVIAVTAVFGAAASGGSRGADRTVDAEVVLAADVSRSIDEGEFQLEREGYAKAIVSNVLLDAIRSGERGAIALAYVEWAGGEEQKVVVDWTVVRDEASARAFADALTSAPRAFVGRTAIGSAIAFSEAVSGESGIDAPRRIIDVSGDGVNNQGQPVTDARGAAVKAGFIINGLTIYNKRAAAMGGYLEAHTNPPGGLAQYYRDHVIGGPGSFVLPIDDFAAFGDAMTRKLVDEIAARPSGAERPVKG